ncbi:MAG: ABC transporter substrate-binding protein, partial [Clostridium sp.]|nr:ABC transporter substrate-binding protein [Clostridium sp.]
MKKRIVSLLLPVVMAGSVLAGCTPSTPTSTAGPGTSTEGTTTAEG